MVRSLPRLPDHPDGPFVEDLGVGLPEVFVLGRSAEPTRRGEAGATAAALPTGEWERILTTGGGRERAIARIAAPGTLDGGDILVVGRRILVGHSSRTNATGERLLRDALEPHGYRVEAVPVRGALHLKTACTALDEETLLVNPRWVDRGALRGFRVEEADPLEPFGANVLAGPRAIVAPESAPRTRRRLESAGRVLLEVDVSEFEKAEGGVTCLSLRLP